MKVLTGVGMVILGLGLAAPAEAQVTFAKDIAPILQRSCQNCHRPNGAGPMPLITYEDVRPWARAIKTRTGIGPRAGVMPPWYVEKNVGIQGYKDDPSLSDEEIAKIAKWADGGAPLGNPADLPQARVFEDDTVWRIGKPDLIVKMADVNVKANSPDWWGEVPSVPTGLTEDRYVAAIEIKEVNDAKPSNDGRHTVGGRSTPFCRASLPIGLTCSFPAEIDFYEEYRAAYAAWQATSPRLSGYVSPEPRRDLEA